ncbi:hypothetical protein PTTG_31068, partial [Puccinia triticina 1-1 BBBD Race 1]
MSDPSVNPESKAPITEQKEKSSRPATAIKKTKSARLALAQKQERLQTQKNFKEAQDHALSISNALSRIKITSPLNESNFPNWSTQIIGNLRSLGLAELMLNDEETEVQGDFELVEKRC